MSKFPEWYRQEAIELYKCGISYKILRTSLVLVLVMWLA